MRQTAYHECEGKKVALAACIFDPHSKAVRADLARTKPTYVPWSGRGEFSAQWQDHQDCRGPFCDHKYHTFSSRGLVLLGLVQSPEIVERCAGDVAISEMGIKLEPADCSPYSDVLSGRVTRDQSEMRSSLLWSGCSYEIRECI